jgi:hypothetical protein
MLSQVSAVARETNVAATILDHLSIPILLVDRNANVDYANLTARSLVADGVSLTIVDHIFGGRHRDGAASLRAAIVDTCVNGVGERPIETYCSGDDAVCRQSASRQPRACHAAKRHRT